MTVATKYTMAELRAHKGSLFIKNNEGFLFTLHEKVGNGLRVDIELKPVGQPDSITYLSPEALDAPGIARNIAKGKIVVSPDLEDEMIALMSNGAQASDKLLSEYQIDVQESPNARAIDVRDKMSELLEKVERKRIVPQGQQSVTGGSALQDFINPGPYKVEDGRVFNPQTGEFTAENKAETPSELDYDIKSITVTAPKSVPE